MLRLSTTNVACAGYQGAHVGRSALGRAPGDAGLCAAPRAVSDLRDSHRAGRVRGGPRTHHPAPAATHWTGLPVDADVACGRPPWRQLEQSPPRHLGADEIYRGKAEKFSTVLSDLVHGEVIGLAKDRSEASLTRLLTTCLDARQRAAVKAVCTDMHQPYVNAVGTALKAEIVFDKFHVLQHASAA